MARGGTPEGQLHSAVVQWLKSAPFSVPVVWSHLATGRGGPTDGATLKNLGCRPGMPDFIFFFRGGVALIELKSPKGYASKVQKVVFADLKNTGHPVYVCRNLEQVRDVLIGCGLFENADE